ncbi:MAG TPA: transcriptional regulator [Ochrobactrum intermedium]|uniref:Transcriptional regulator n=1 Tax=Brucella intermedia TaxID=94625 RepID=A0A7V6PBA3_9HYPH|nr:ATP-binding protein [Brucella intermedia]HHV67847.1 transcriptional regulator [Brucella intermedia]
MIPKESSKDLIRILNETDETENLEAKLCSKSVSKSVYETICALSNEPDLGGGTILLGVEKEEALFSFYTAVGVTDPDKISSDIASACQTTFNIPIRLDIHAEKVDRNTIIRINVPELPKASKPLYFKATGLPRGAYRRIGPTDVRCTDEDMPVFFSGKAEQSFDEQIVRDAHWGDIDPKAIQAYRSARAETNPHAETLSWSDQELLHAIGAIRYVDGVVKITNTGLIVFGTNASLRRLAPAHRVDYIRIPGNQWVEDPETPFQSIDMRGPLITLVARVMAAISDDLPKVFRVGSASSGQRQETPVVPLRVLREAVVNSLMHRNFQLNRPVQVLRYGNRITIKNPGYSLKNEDRFDESGSIIRNPKIAEILHETRFAETKGSGIRVMRKMMAESGLAEPTFESDRESDEFTATLLFHHFLDENDIQWLSKFKDIELTNDQLKALIFVREVGAISNSVYRSMTKTDTLTASKSLRKLRTLALFSEHGSGRSISYVPGPEMLLRLNNGELSPTIHGKAATMDGSNILTVEHLPPQLRTVVKAVHLSSRLVPESAMQLIEDLCAWRELSLVEISELLVRSPSHVSQRYIGPMIESGRLAYTFPEMPQHPNQKYKSSRK